MADKEHITHEDPLKVKHKNKDTFDKLSKDEVNEILLKLAQDKGLLPKTMTLK